MQLLSQNQRYNLKSENSFKTAKNEHEAKHVQSSKHQLFSNQQFLQNTQEDYSKNFGSTSLLDQEENNQNQTVLNNQSNSHQNQKICQQSNENINFQSKVQVVPKQFQLDYNYFISEAQSSRQKKKLNLTNSCQQVQKSSQENQNMFTPRFIHITSTDRQQTPSIKSNSQSQYLEQITQIKDIQNILKSFQTEQSHSFKNKQNPFKTFYYQSPQKKADYNYNQEMHKINIIKDNFRCSSFLHINKMDIQKSNSFYQKNKLQNQQKAFCRQIESNYQSSLNLNLSNKLIDKPQKLISFKEENSLQEPPYQSNQPILNIDQLDQIQNINYFKQIFPKQNEQQNSQKKRQNIMSDSPHILKTQNSSQRMLQSRRSEYKQGEFKMLNSFSSKRTQQKTNLIYFLNDENVTKSYGFQTPRKIIEENNIILTERLWKTGSNFLQINQKRSESYKNSFYKQNSFNSDKQECYKVDNSQYKNFQILEDFIQKKEKENSLKKSNLIMNQNMMKYNKHIKQKKQLKQEEDQQINTLLQNYVQNQYSYFLQKIIKTKKIQPNLNQTNINISKPNLLKKNTDQIQKNPLNAK
ncbi:hypothetical protein ABPG72_004354 [Tetrahymena utriculariae]